MSKLPAIFLFLMSTFPESRGYNILVLSPFPGHSHWLWMEHFVRELLDRGHEVTAVTNFKTNRPHENYTEILIDPPFDFLPYFPIKDIFDMRYGSDFENLKMYWRTGLLTSNYGLSHKNVQQLIHSNNQHFDLVISEQFAQESFLMFAQKFQCPFITIGTLGWSDYMDRNFGFYVPWSIFPHPIPVFSNEFSFKERIYNVFFSITDAMFRYYKYLPAQDKLAREYFGSVINGELPYVGDIEKNVSVMLINHHRSLPPIRPLMPGQINVAGAHIRPPKPLPKDLQYLMNNSTNGVIVFSLGSYIKSTFMPKAQLQSFINVFGNLSQTVLWKYEANDIEKLPPNIKLQKWLPQSDVLGHDNVVLFITHGGMFGSQEGLARGVPMLFIPFYGDQHRNAFKAQEAGYGQTLPYSELTETKLAAAIDEMLNNEKYVENAKKWSRIFTENPIHPMDEAIFWIEYVIEHKGASFIKSKSAINLKWYQHFLLDIGLLVLAVVVLLGVSLIVSLRILRKFLSDNSKSKKD